MPQEVVDNGTTVPAYAPRAPAGRSAYAMAVQARNARSEAMLHNPASAQEVYAGVDNIITQMERFLRAARSGVRGEMSLMAEIGKNHHTNSYFASTYEVFGNVFSGGKSTKREDSMLQASEARRKNFVKQADDFSFFMREISEMRDLALEQLGEKVPTTPTDNSIKTTSYIGLHKYSNYKLMDYMDEARDALANNDTNRLTHLLSYSNTSIQRRFPLEITISANTNESKRLDFAASFFTAGAESNMNASEFALKAAEKAGYVADVGLIIFGGGALLSGKAGLKAMASSSLKKPSGLLSLAKVPGLREVAADGAKYTFKQEAKQTARIGTTLLLKDIAKETGVETLNYSLGNKTYETALNDWKTNVITDAKDKAAWTLGGLLGVGFNRGTTALFDKILLKSCLISLPKLLSTTFADLFGFNLGMETGRHPIQNPISSAFHAFNETTKSAHGIAAFFKTAAQFLRIVAPEQKVGQTQICYECEGEDKYICVKRKDGKEGVIDLQEALDDVLYPNLYLDDKEIRLDDTNTHATLSDKEVLYVYNDEYLAIINKNSPVDFELRDKDNSIPAGIQPSGDVREVVGLFFQEFIKKAAAEEEHRVL